MKGHLSVGKMLPVNGSIALQQVSPHLGKANDDKGPELLSLTGRRHDRTDSPAANESAQIFKVQKKTAY